MNCWQYNLHIDHGGPLNVPTRLFMLMAATQNYLHTFPSARADIRAHTTRFWIYSGNNKENAHVADVGGRVTGSVALSNWR